MKNTPERIYVISAVVAVSLSVLPATLLAATNTKRPTMLEIPGGRFVQGHRDLSANTSDSAPVREVVLEPFAISRTEITVAEFRAFVDATGYRTDAERNVVAFGDAQMPGCFLRRPGSTPPVSWVAGSSWRGPGFPQGDNHPVVCVSWNDASAYVAWLAEVSGQPFRLPSESEQEYLISMARNAVANGCAGANVGDADLREAFHDWPDGAMTCSDGHAFTASVGSYPSDSFDLHDIIGNVSEWSADCWHNNYTDAPRDGRAWGNENGGDCSLRVLRGMDFVAVPNDLEASTRSYIPRAFRSYHVGFRIARDVSNDAR